jgi:hypothetical protein
MTTYVGNIPLNELPDWMRQARRGVDWGILLVIGFCLALSWPFIQNTSLPHTNANENYVYRTADYAQAIREGWLYPRWSSNALGGYGAPIPNFYPPGAAYSAALLQVLFTNDPVSAVRLLYILALCQAGSSTYVFVTRRAGASAGVLAAILYVYSPYVGLTVPHILGDLPGVLTLAFIPTLLWAVDRSLAIRRPLDILLVSLATSALCLTSGRGLVIGLIFAAAVILWHWITTRQPIPMIWLTLTVILGLGIASFYWIPAFLEQENIMWRSAAPTEVFHVSLGQIFAPIRPIDPNEMVTTPQFTIGPIIPILAAAGALAAIRVYRQTRFEQLFLLMGSIIVLTALLLFPEQTWLLGPATFCLAIGAGAILIWGSGHLGRWQRIVLPMLIVMIWVTSRPIWLAENTNESFGPTDIATQILYEQQSGRAAVLAPGEPTPATLPDFGISNRFLVSGLQSQTVNKLAPSQDASNFQASPLGHFTHSDHFQIRRVLETATVDVLTAYFPGWYAELSGRRIPLWRAPETGQIRIQIPVMAEGAGELVVALGTTSIRAGSWIISWAILVMGLLLTLRRARTIKAPFEDMVLLTVEQSRLIALPLACIVLILLLTITHLFPFSLFAQPDSGLENTLHVESRTDAGLNLLAIRLPTNAYQPGESVHLTLYWQARRFLDDNYQVTIYLVNTQDGSQWSEGELQTPGFYPSSRWNTHQYVTDRHTISLAPDMPPSNYQIKVEVYRCNPACSSQLTFFDPSGQPQGIVLTLPMLVAIH